MLKYLFGLLGMYVDIRILNFISERSVRMFSSHMNYFNQCLWGTGEINNEVNTEGGML